MSSISFDLSSSRITIFSPHSVGRHETRKSRSRLRSSTFILILMRPSCGRRFSAMSSLAMILTRDVSGSFSFMGSAITLYRMPSMRKRTRNSFSYGSMWMSEAPRFSESTSSTFVSLMTGAASADLVRLPRSISSSSLLTVSTSASASPIESRSISDRPPIEAMSSTLSPGPSPIASLRLGPPPPGIP